MGDFDAIGALRDPVLLAAFAGADDVADAASECLWTLVETWDATLVAELDLASHLDYAHLDRWRPADRPRRDAELKWPTLRVWHGSPAGLERDVLLVQGMAPHSGWPTVCRWITDLFDHADAQLLAILAARAQDVAYDAPLPVHATTSQSGLGSASHHRAPPRGHAAGFVAELDRACAELHLPSITFWGSVPDYLDTGVCPKTSVALVSVVEDVLGITITTPELVEASRAWQRGVEQLAAEQTPAGRAVRAKAASQDAWRSPHASGEAIAEDFERYLRRREQQ